MENVTLPGKDKKKAKLSKRFPVLIRNIRHVLIELLLPLIKKGDIKPTVNDMEILFTHWGDGCLCLRHSFLAMGVALKYDDTLYRCRFEEVTRLSPWLLGFIKEEKEIVVKYTQLLGTHIVCPLPIYLFLPFFLNLDLTFSSLPFSS